MGLEAGTKISDLVETNPLASDGKTQGDDHLRLIKSILKLDAMSIAGTHAAGTKAPVAADEIAILDSAASFALKKLTLLAVAGLTRNLATNLLLTVAGADTITATSTPALTAQAATGTLWLMPAAAANTGAATLNIDGQGAVSILRNDATVLQAGDIKGPGTRCLLYKAPGAFILLNPALLSADELAQAATEWQKDMQAQAGVAYATTGTADAFELTPSPALTAIAAYQQFFVRFHLAPNAWASINISGLGARSLYYVNAAGVHVPLTAGLIPAQHMSRVVNYSTYSLILDVPANAAIGSNYQAFTANGTWTKPTGLTGDEVVEVWIWGGGGGGATVVGGIGGGGGGGGAFTKVQFKASQLGATESVVVGAGGAAGTAGGNSSFNDVLSYGGGGGGGSTAYGGGGGGGSKTAGGFLVAGDGYFVAGSTASTVAALGDGGGRGGAYGTPANAGGAAYMGGGGGGGMYGYSSAVHGGASVWGGGGGGGNPGGSGGASTFGGAGGAQGAAGIAPGGGGGGSVPGAPGARGEVRVWVLR